MDMVVLVVLERNTGSLKQTSTVSWMHVAVLQRMRLVPSYSISTDIKKLVAI
jgi:hypothetical protein